MHIETSVCLILTIKYHTFTKSTEYMGISEVKSTTYQGSSSVVLVLMSVSALSFLCICKLYEPRCEKTGLRGFRTGPTQTGLYSHRRWLEA